MAKIRKGSDRHGMIYVNSSSKVIPPSRAMVLLDSYISLALCILSAACLLPTEGVAGSVVSVGEGSSKTRALQSTGGNVASEQLCSICGTVGGPSKLKPNVLWDGTFSNFGMLPASNTTTCQSIEDLASTFEPPSLNNTNETITTSCLGLQSLAYIQCCDMTDWPTPVYECEQRVQEAWEEIGYNTAVVPLPSGGGKLNVDVSLIYYHLAELSTVEGTARIVMGVNLRWRDERLSWSPEDMGGCVSTSTLASLDAELTSIWVPDFNLVNRLEGVHTFSARHAEVFANGEVNWYRPSGSFEAICGFRGLERFPFDTLECTLDFGSLSEISKIRYVQELAGPGLIVTDKIGSLGAERIQPQYQEFIFVEDMTAVERLNDERLRLKVYFERAPQYYRTTVVVPTILLTFLSFGQFVLDQRVGERLGFAVSLLLVMVAQSLVTAEIIPRSEEKMWVHSFISWSLVFMFFGAFESVLVAALHFMGGNESPPSSLSPRDASIANGGEPALDNDFNDIDAVDGGKEQNNTVEPASQSASSDSRTKSSFVSKALRRLWTVLFAEPNLAESKKVRAIKTLDRLCFIMTPIAYTIYFTYMLARKTTF